MDITQQQRTELISEQLKAIKSLVELAQETVSKENNLADALEREIENAVDSFDYTSNFHSAEFELNYDNRVELVGFQIDTDELTQLVLDAVLKTLNINE